MCGDGGCIERDHVCDSILDCADHSDAKNCSRGLTSVVYLQPSDIPQQCPEANDLPSVCTDSCSSNADCRAGEACCRSGCGMTCVVSLPVRPVCRSIARQRQQAGLLGAFVPSCEEDGSFSEHQCRAGLCWCVDVETGQPVSNGTRVRSSCTRCSRGNGRDSVAVGTSFTSDDGCNTW